MKRLLSILLLACSIAHAQTALKTSVLLQPATQTTGVSAARLARIDALLQEYVDKGWIPGATAIVAKDGKIIYHKAVGYSDVSKRTPLTKDAIFRIASQTKAITSVGIMMLWEEGKLLLDDPVSKYIPEFKSPKVLASFNKADTSYTTTPANGEITLRQLLSHTSGIGYAGIGTPEMNAIYAKAGVISGIGAPQGVVLADKIKVLGTLPLQHQPGKQFTYGLNTDVLGYVIEVVSGMPLDRFFQERIFAPLSMKDTYFYLPQSKYSRLVPLHTEDREIKQVKLADVNLTRGVNPNYPAAPGTYFSGGAGLSSTAYDYALFMQMLLNGGTYNGVRLLAPATVRLMTTNQIGAIERGWGHKFGLGFELVTPQSKAYTALSEGSFSWGGYFSSQYWIDPEKKIVGQIFINLLPNSHGEIHDKFKNMVYAALE